MGLLWVESETGGLVNAVVAKEADQLEQVPGRGAISLVTRRVALVVTLASVVVVGFDHDALIVVIQGYGMITVMFLRMVAVAFVTSSEAALEFADQVLGLV